MWSLVVGSVDNQEFSMVAKIGTDIADKSLFMKNKSGL